MCSRRHWGGSAPSRRCRALPRPEASGRCLALLPGAHDLRPGGRLGRSDAPAAALRQPSPPPNLHGAAPYRRGHAYLLWLHAYALWRLSLERWRRGTYLRSLPKVPTYLRSRPTYAPTYGPYPGENILWEKTGPDYWLVAISGLPFGLHADMLGPAAGAANAMRGMVFGMLTRAGWGGSKSAQNARLWALWDAFGLEHAEMRGWWEPRPAAATGSAAVVATAYVRRGLRALVAVGSWQKAPWRGALAPKPQLSCHPRPVRAAAPCTPGCSPMHSRLQPFAV